MRYEHGAGGRIAAIAEAMSNVVTLKPRTAWRKAPAEPDGHTAGAFGWRWTRIGCQPWA